MATILGVGIDLVEINRAKRLIQQNRRFLKQFLSPKEYKIVQKAKLKSKAFGLLFAAKEAVSKAMGISIQSPRAFADYAVYIKDGKLCCDFLKKGLKTKHSFILWPFEETAHMGVIAFKVS
ncbi:MAG: phosphopantetheine--protein transferase-like protein [Candidatus Omnitrophota bacterium]|jgi:phosphopantetheine--protein transferase-like protein